MEIDENRNIECACVYACICVSVRCVCVQHEAVPNTVNLMQIDQGHFPQIS